VGSCGRYRPFAAHQQFRLATAIWKDGIIRQPGASGKTHFQLDLPESYSVRAHDQSWTGRSIQYLWHDENGKDAGVDMDLRSTLPGVRLAADGRSINVRWGDNLPDGFKALDAGGGSFGLVKHADLSRHRFLVLQSRVCPILIVLSQPLKAINVTAHSHWEFRFAASGGAMFVVPMTDERQLPVDDSQQAIWSALLAHPPRQCAEEFQIDGDELSISARFPNAEYAPVPPLVTQAGEMRGLLQIHEPRIYLFDSLLGPYEVVQGDRWSASIALGWTKASRRGTKAVEGDLSAMPEELAYPGDWSWNPRQEPLDQLLALRTWAPLLGLIPGTKRDELIAQLHTPTPAAFRASLHDVTEPVTGKVWSKEKSLFDTKGDCSWDADWYNGFSLSGMARAVDCGVEEIAASARTLVRECRPERERMARYYELFHDWSLWSSWTDARGLFWLPDCAHNGLEGILAEARLRRAEGDVTGADRMLYLAGRTGVCLMALFSLSGWCEKVGFVMPTTSMGFLRPGEVGAETFGVNALVDTDGIATVTVETKNPYCLAGHFPEYSALLRQHGPVERLRRLAELWAQTQPQRYADWIGFYIGTDPVEIAKRRANLDQEAKDQAAVFYHLAPEVCLRLWVLDEPADQIEQRFKTPLNLAEQLLLRADVRLVESVTK
jgi:hypothetical protein